MIPYCCPQIQKKNLDSEDVDDQPIDLNDVLIVH
jgi:hypothetical protein